MKLLSEKEIIIVFERFKKENPHPSSELKWKNPFTLLVAVVLSAQATDKSVNKATESLFKIADSPQKIIKLGQEKLESYIKSIGLYHSKAKNIIALSKMLLSDFSGEVPATHEELMRLPGVGRKTANVVLNVVFNKKTMPVDTHIFRIAPKIGIAEGKNVEQVEENLLARIPDKYMNHAHHWLILHGRYVCTAKNPKCSECIIGDICKHNEKSV
ncbi:MAG: endonuclease III [Treponema sp.]|nr:endonuclease III [Treponema sp.]